MEPKVKEFIIFACIIFLGLIALFGLLIYIDSRHSSENTVSDSGKTGSPLDARKEKFVREQLKENLTKIVKEKISSVHLAANEQLKCTFRLPTRFHIRDVENGSYPPNDCVSCSAVRDK